MKHPNAMRVPRACHAHASPNHPIFAAVSSGLRDKVETLLRLGADPDYEEGYYQMRNETGDETLIPAYRFPADAMQGGPVAIFKTKHLLVTHGERISSKNL